MIEKYFSFFLGGHMGHRIDSGKIGLCSGFNSAIKTLAIILAILPIASADLTGLNISNDLSLKNSGVDVALDVYEAANNTTHIFERNGAPENAKYEIYKITVTNTGDTPLDSVILSAVLAKSMDLINTSYLEASRGKPEVKVDPEAYDEDFVTNVIWNLGSLASEEIKTVIMALYLKKEGARNSDVAVTVMGIAPDGTEATDSQSSADIIPGCAWFIEDEEGYLAPCQEETAEFTPGCKEMCPEWIKSFSPP